MRLVSGYGSSSTFTDKLSRLTEKAKKTTEYKRQFMEWERQKAYEFRRGKAEGIAEGALQKAVEGARNFYSNGVSVEIIAKSLGMTIEQVEDIVKGSIQKEA